MEGHPSAEESSVDRLFIIFLHFFFFFFDIIWVLSQPDFRLLLFLFWLIDFFLFPLKNAIELFFRELVSCWILVTADRLNLVHLVHPIPGIVLLLKFFLTTNQQSSIFFADAAFFNGHFCEHFKDTLAHFSVIFRLVGGDSKVSLFLIAKEWALDCIDVRNIQDIVEYLPSCQIVSSSEPIWSVVKPAITPADHHREYFDQIAVVGGWITIKESA